MQRRQTLPSWIYHLGPPGDEQALSASTDDGSVLTLYSEVSEMVKSWLPDWTSFVKHFTQDHNGAGDATIVTTCRELRILLQLVFAMDTVPVTLPVVEQVIFPNLLAHRDNNSLIMGMVQSNVCRYCDYAHTWNEFDLLRFICSNPNVRYEVVKFFLDSNVIEKLHKNSSESPKLFFDKIDEESELERRHQLYSMMATSITHQSVEAARAIISHDPSVLEMKNASSLTPIHLVFSYENENKSTNKSVMLHFLLEEGKRHGIQLARKIGHEPQESMWTKFRKGKWKMIRHENILLSSPLDLSLYQLNKKFKRKKKIGKNTNADEWKCLSLCVEAVKEFDPSFDIINYIISWRPTAYGFLIEVIEQLEIDLCLKDEHGRTPLLNAILQKPQSYYMIEQLLQATDDHDIDLEAFDRYVDDSGNIIYNRHLLHQALGSKMQTELLWKMIHLDPDALQARDSVTGLYPFLQASSKDYSLHAVYNILRHDPSVVTLTQNFQSISSSSLTKKSEAAYDTIPKYFVAIIVGLLCIFVQQYHSCQN